MKSVQNKSGNRGIRDSKPGAENHKTHDVKPKTQNTGRGTLLLARPDNCLVGCVTCSNTCLFNAISFPDKAEIKKIIIENNILARAKEELEKK